MSLKTSSHLNGFFLDLTAKFPQGIYENMDSNSSEEEQNGIIKFAP